VTGGARRPPPQRSAALRGHWFFVALVLLVFSIALLVEGYSHGVIGESPQTANQAGDTGPAAPYALVHGGPVINATGRTTYSYRLPAGEVALTFDDGPDPTWTPKILAILRRYHVPATFFVVGTHVASYPSIVRAEVAAGDDVGSHTYTHVNVAAAGWQLPLQLTLTQNALAGAAGIRTNLMRPPYSSEPYALHAANWRGYQRAARFGYLIVLATTDTRDWARPGVARIVANALAWRSWARSAVIMMHDSGGDRSQTVRALPLIITALQARGYRFVTISGGLHLRADVPATSRQRLIGLALVIVQQAADRSVAVLAVALVIASVMLVLRLLTLMFFARMHRRRRRRLGLRQPIGPVAPGISVVIPAYNEAAGIAATVRSMVGSSYPGELEVIVVDDGSTDNTAGIVRGLRLPGVHVISQRNAGKPAALNRGIAEAWYDILVLVDGDTIFGRRALGLLAQRLAEPGVGAVSGNTKVANRNGLIGRWQHLEYVMGFNLDRRMFDVLGTIPTVPGAIGAFRREALEDVGGVSADTLAEDTDLTMALCRSGWRVVYEPGAVAWTEAPATLRQLWRQRYRWCYGTMQSMWKHRRSVIDRGPSGRFGRRCLTYLAFYQILLPLIAPTIDLAAIYGVVFLNLARVLAFYLGFTVLQLLACGYALRLDRERLRTLWALPLQQVVYRQLMYLVTIESVITALLGSRQRWQAMKRTGVFAGPVGPAPARRPRAEAAR
jgi:cellulose synthase/poly-beta-1,6-N-acetylglucosamine synthase-like glycosyltransferase/peptidoglycan/xylan/chitin deacetylase (PgdA/CDA1 family)